MSLPLQPVTHIVRVGGWSVSFLDFFDHIDLSFLKFLALYGVWHGWGTILKLV